MPSILPLDLQQILSQALSFLLLLWVLKRFAWRPLLGVLDARRARIEEESSRAAQHTVELERLKVELHHRLSKIDEETRSRIQQAIQDGRRIAMEIQDEARSQAQGILAKSKETIALELAKARVALRDELAEMAIETTERLLRQKLDPETDKAIVEHILEQLETSDHHGQ